MTPLERLLDRLDGVRRVGASWLARCPAHPDKNPSLSISEGDDGCALVNCFAGCEVDAVLAAIGLTTADLFAERKAEQERSRARVVAEYEYHDENGNLLYVVERWHPKRFRQKRPNGNGGWIYNMNGVTRVPYRLREVLEGIKDDRWILIPEGEKDVENLRDRDFVATTNSEGAEKWRNEWAPKFAGAKVAILPHNDPPGSKHGEQVAASLAPFADLVKRIDLEGLPEHGDVSYWLGAGGTAEELKKLIRQAPAWEPRTAVPTGGHHGSVIRVCDVAAERVEWLWEARLPRGKLVIIDGDPGELKSTLTLDMAARTTTGSPWPDGSGNAPLGNVVLLSAEDGIGDTIRPRLEAHGADLKRVVVFASVPGGVDDQGNPLPARPPSIPGDLDELERIVTHEQAVLVVIDPLSAFLSSRVDSHRDQDVRGALMPLARLAERTGATVLVVRHLSKTGGTNAIYRGGGSIGIIGAARAAMMVGRDPEDEGRRILAMTKSNLAALPQAMAYRAITDEEHGCARIVWDGTTEHRAADLLALQSEEERTASAEAKEFLIALLRSGPLPSTEVKKLARAEGIAERTLERARPKAGVEHQRHGFGKGSVVMWRLAYSPHTSHTRQPSEPGEYGEYEGSDGEYADGSRPEGSTRPPEDGEGSDGSSSQNPAPVARPSADDDGVLGAFTTHAPNGESEEGEASSKPDPGANRPFSEGVDSVDDAPEREVAVGRILRCSRCRRIGVLDPCRECATPQEFARYPEPPEHHRRR